MRFKFTLVLIFFVMFITGCSNKNEVEYNKPAIYWYQQIIKEASRGDLDSADEYYTSLVSEHTNSFFLKEAMLILAQAHIENEEYLLAKFYLDEYIKKYGDKESIELAKYLKVKASFLAFKYPFRDQEFLYETLKEAKEFKSNYENSIYLPFVETIITRVSLAIDNLNREIGHLYDRMDKPKAKELYFEKLSESPLKDLKTQEAEVAWYREIFE